MINKEENYTMSFNKLFIKQLMKRIKLFPLIVLGFIVLLWIVSVKRGDAEFWNMLLEIKFWGILILITGLAQLSDAVITAIYLLFRIRKLKYIKNEENIKNENFK